MSTASPAAIRVSSASCASCAASTSPEACAVIETAPGEEAQVDYGTGPMVRDPHSGKYRRTRLFVLTLGYSRKSVRLLVFRSSSQTWAELHEKAFRRLGGVTRVVVLDNLREGVLTPDIYDPTLNPLYRDVLQHYGAVRSALPRRDPDRKGKVESGRRPCEEYAAERTRFESLEEAQTYLDHWEDALGRHAHSRHHQAAGRRHVRRREAGLAAAAPRALPLLPIRRAHGASGWLRGSRCGLLRRAAGLDRPARPGAMGSPAGPPAGPADRPAAARAPAPGAWRPSHQRRRPPQADAAGHATAAVARRPSRSQIGALCRGMHQEQGETAVRRILGVLSLAKKYGAASGRGCLRRRPGNGRPAITASCAAIWSAIRNCR